MRRILKGFTLVEIMIVVLVIGVLAAIAVPALLRSKMGANDAYAKQALRTMSAAAEWYSNNNTGYPDSETVLLSAAPPYLNSSYCGITSNGYTYSCAFSAGGYTLDAVPVTVGSTGTTTMTISTGGLLVP